MTKGLLITVEGTDGAGKTTQIKLMEKYLVDKGYEVVLIREPGGSKIGEQIRNVILDPNNVEMAKITEMLLYASSRAQLVEETIKPKLFQNKIIICDRFVDSSLVYQGVARGIGIELVKMVNDIALNGLTPDITFFLDVDPQTALHRRLTATKADRIESEKVDFHIRVYEGYKKISSMYGNRIKPIDANRKSEEIFEDIKILLGNILSKIKTL